MRFRTFVMFMVLPLLVANCGKKSGSGDLDTGAGGDGERKIENAGIKLNTVYFAFDSSALNDHSKATLKGNASALTSDYSGKSVVIEGHCDERGTVEYNMALGERRARASYDYLKSIGIAASRMSTVSYGKERPLDPGHNESAWSKNRRDEFIVQ